VTGDPDLHDLLEQLGEALGHEHIARPVSPAEVWAEYLCEVRRLIADRKLCSEPVGWVEGDWRHPAVLCAKPLGHWGDHGRYVKSSFSEGK
jgi:hypothetical protein